MGWAAYEEPEDEATTVSLAVDTTAFTTAPTRAEAAQATSAAVPDLGRLLTMAPAAIPEPAPAPVLEFAAHSAFRAPVNAQNQPIESPVLDTPKPHVLLNAFAETGVFDPNPGAAAPEWERPPETRTRLLVPLFVLLVVVIGGLAGGVRYRAMQGKPALQQAELLENEIDSLLQAGQASSLIEQRFSRAFDLNANSSRLWLLWTRERSLRSLETGIDVQGIDGAADRARKSGVSEARLAFARIASYLANHDVVDALLTVSTWDTRAGDDPYFHLLAGAALDRAGDGRSIERYETAAKLAPELIVARILLTRAAILQGDGARGLELLREFRVKWPTRPEGAALAALAWASDPSRRSSPPEFDLAKQHRDELPAPLAATIEIAGSVEAMQKHRLTDARSALSSALRQAQVPALSALVGSLALELGDEDLARSAAAQAVADSPLYIPGRVLSARMFMTQGRYDEADRSVADLDASLPTVALVRGLLAYERLDQPTLVRALEGLPLDVRSRAEALPIRQALEVLRGAIDRTESPKLLTRENPWGSLLAIDAALDAGDLRTATALLEATPDTRPPRALRWARLLRHTNKAAQADGPSKLAFDSLGTRRAALERILVLLATDRVEEARAFVTKNAAILGPLAPWALAYVDADGPHAREARARIATFALPDVDTPLAQRTLVLLTLCDLGDRSRAIPIIRSLARFVPKNPEMIAAARSL